MAILEPKKGFKVGFTSLPFHSEEVILGNAEKIIWASIKRVCVEDFGDFILHRGHKIKNRKKQDILYVYSEIS